MGFTKKICVLSASLVEFLHDFHVITTTELTPTAKWVIEIQLGLGLNNYLWACQSDFPWFYPSPTLSTWSLFYWCWYGCCFDGSLSLLRNSGDFQMFDAIHESQKLFFDLNWRFRDIKQTRCWIFVITNGKILSHRF